MFGNKIKNANISVLISGGCQALNGVFSIIMVPFLLSILGSIEYGLWITIASLITWITQFDFGIGYSFKNRVTNSIATNNQNSLQEIFILTFKYYLIISILMIILFLFAYFFNSFVSANKVISLIVYLPFILLYPLNISTPILQGLRLVHKVSIFNVLKTGLWFIFVMVLYFSKIDVTVILISIVFSFFLQTTLFVQFIYTFKKAKLILPSRKDLIKKITYDKMIAKGMSFFILQISSIILFSTGNYLVYKNLSAVEVVNYDTLNKLFTFSLSLFSVIISVYWSEIVFFNSTHDVLKLKSIYKKLLGFSLIFSLILLFSTYFVPYFVLHWTQSKVEVSSLQCLPFAILVSVQAIAYSGAVFLNAFEKIKLQIVISIIGIILFWIIVNHGFENNWGFVTTTISGSLVLLPSLLYSHIRTLLIVFSK